LFVREMQHPSCAISSPNVRATAAVASTMSVADPGIGHRAIRGDRLHRAARGGGFGGTLALIRVARGAHVIDGAHPVAVDLSDREVGIGVGGHVRADAGPDIPRARPGTRPDLSRD